MTKRIKLLLVALSIGGLLQGAPLFFYEEILTTPTTVGRVEVTPNFGPTGEYRLEIKTDTVTTNVYSYTLDFLFTPIEISRVRLALYRVKPGMDKLIKTDEWDYQYSIPEPTAMGLITVGGLVTLIAVRIKRGV